jgi:hypothetical protein
VSHAVVVKIQNPGQVTERRRSQTEQNYGYWKGDFWKAQSRRLGEEGIQRERAYSNLAVAQGRSQINNSSS